jgi:hypothetical protein
MAHMERGGCLYSCEDEICRDLYPAFDETISQSSSIHEINLDEPVVQTSVVVSQVRPVPDAAVSELIDGQTECCICYETIGEKNNCVTECGHKFCFKCLMMAMARNNSCPCCRAPLTDVPDQEEDVDDDEEYDDDEDESDDEEESDDPAPVETIVERLEKQGFTMLDLVSIMLNRRSKIDVKYTEEYVEGLLQKFDNTQIDADNEADEQREFAAEDTRPNVA